MKIGYQWLVWMLCIGLAGCSSGERHKTSDEVNPIIGNESYAYFFGKEPDDFTDEFLRVQTHLRYAEKILREKEVGHLNEEQKQSRARLLKLLNEYRQNGIYPANTKYPGERKPCFIDDSGRICAVGYLVEKTAGRQLAERINAQYQYSEISEMNIPELHQWIAESGLTPEEVATIQPTYGTYVFRSNQLTFGGGISSRTIEAGYPAFTAGYQYSENVMTFYTAAGFETLGPDDYLAGLRLGYGRQIKKIPGTISLGVTPSYFEENSNTGMNLKPDLSYALASRPWKRFSLQMMLSYGYDFAIDNRSAFPLSRHDLSVKAAMLFRLKSKPKVVW